MRVLVALLGFFLVIGGSITASPTTAAGQGIVASYFQPGTPDGIAVDIDVDSGSRWYADPIWIGVGIVALILIVAIVARSKRSTT